ncbi:two-component system, OmpR family, sensor histidine kinase QseC [Burkholderiaceae bacterium]|nr:two-component system, OmpR family, sensor histidine kinase QseC [Burkholderiaceae bacterium]
MNGQSVAEANTAARGRRPPMSLKRRLLLYLLLCAPAVWAVAMLVSVDRARHEVNELFDTEMIRLAREVQATIGSQEQSGALPAPPPPEGSAEAGEADVRDLAVAVWDAHGRRVLNDREGVQLPHRPSATGFVEEPLNGESWRVYYLQSASGEWLVAAGQRVNERDELVFDLTASQALPWLVVLPVLLLVMGWAVQRALAPLDRLATELAGREADDLQPVAPGQAPGELQPLLVAMNALFGRIEELLARERRFTADAAHELRTPLAVLRAQWDVHRHVNDPRERMESEERLRAGFDRLERLVTQMLALSHVESVARPTQAAEIDWRPIVEQAMSDCLPLAERREIELACEWPPAGRHAMPLFGDAQLLAVLLRNLLDNALRYAPARSLVTLRFGDDRMEVENDGEPLNADELSRIGERFYRPQGQQETGSGLGLSIVRRIAALHGLEVSFGPRVDGRGMRVTLSFAAPRSAG